MTTSSDRPLPRTVFTICTGRCGTQLLAERLAALPGVVSLHEPDPNFVDVMPAASRDREVARKFLLGKKLPAIAASGGKVYAETSHVFCKGFLEPLLDYGVVPQLILLKRPHRDVALSLLRIGCIPERTEDGRRWLLSPAQEGVLQVEDWKSLSDYQLTYWYCLEIERRQIEGGRLVSLAGGKAASVSLREVRSEAGVLKISRQLDLPRPPLLQIMRYYLSRNVVVNGKKEFSRPLPGEAQISREEFELSGRIKGL